MLDGGLVPSGGAENFGAGFLPAAYQASVLRNQDPPLANIQPIEVATGAQRARLDLMHGLDRVGMAAYAHDHQVEAAIANYELAFRMQAAVPGLVDISGESEATRRLYGMDAPFEHTRTYARQCLIARRLVERGVRFIELTCPHMEGIDRWDAHSELKKNHSLNALATDQPPRC